jgi:RimJ/RimL family protein N-acetyltransferase
LRAWRRGDATVLVEAWADADIAAFCGVPADPTLERAERWIAGWERRRASGAALDLVAVDDADAVIGEVGVHPTGDGLELGWWVLPAHRSQGVATAMVTAFVAWLRTERPGDPVVARIPPGHTASERVAAAAGLTRVGPVDPGHELWRVLGAGADSLHS